MTLPGREALVAQLERLLAGRAGAEVLVVARLRKLGAVADAWGEAAVDQVLATAASRVRDVLGPSAFVADLCEGTYAALVPVAGADVDPLLQRLVAELSRGRPYRGELLSLPANAGACALQTGRGDAHAHLERGLRALQQAMARGGGATEAMSDAAVAEAAERWEMRAHLEEAALRGEFSLQYQPIHALDTGLVLKYEALLRWESPALGAVPPDRFIPVLEESGLIRPAGEWVLREACAHAARWRAESGMPIRVAVNISPVQLAMDFPGEARRILQETGCEAAWIELEITEGALIRDFARVRDSLEALVAMGFTLAIDDFGAGYSSFEQLAQLPVHHLKMDRSLIAGFPGGPKRAGIIRAIVALAGALDLAVTSEGVERPEQADWLAGLGGVFGQGWHFSRPIAPAEVSLRLRSTASVA